MKLLKILVAILLFLLVGFFLVVIFVPTVSYTVSIVVDHHVETTFDGDNTIRFDAEEGSPDDGSVRPSTFSDLAVTSDRIKHPSY